MKMKKTLLLLAVSISVVILSCKNTEEKTETLENDPKLTEQTESYPIYQGEFIYVEDAAVLKGRNFIYGVTLDEKARELANQVAPVKNEDFDMVAVVVKGVVSKNPNLVAAGEGWEEVITIKEIIAVSDKPAEADIKIEETNN